MAQGLRENGHSGSRKGRGGIYVETYSYHAFYPPIKWARMDVRTPGWRVAGEGIKYPEHTPSDGEVPRPLVRRIRVPPRWSDPTRDSLYDNR